MFFCEIQLNLESPEFYRLPGVDHHQYHQESCSGDWEEIGKSKKA
jgi:hypothetical protein